MKHRYKEMRRVKKTSIEQLNVLKAEMAVHPAAARGYRVGANRPLVDAEWKDIMEKLNALGPPYRTLTEWKKVWSDMRLRHRKRALGLPLKRRLKKKKRSEEPEEDVLMEALNSSSSIYDSHVKSNHGVPIVETTNMQQSVDHNEEFDEHNLNPQEGQEYYNADCNYNESCEQTMYEINSIDEMLPTLITIQSQLNEQQKLMSHLLQTTVNLTYLMERQIQACERKTFLMEKQLRANKIHNLLLRRQQRRRKLNCLLT